MWDDSKPTVRQGVTRPAVKRQPQGAHNRQTPEKFWSRVQKGFWSRMHGTYSCWLWTGATNTGGYGSVGWGGKVYTAHRIAAWLSGLVHTAAAPKSKRDPTHVLHTCDNRRCCNPDHFFLGTYRDNMLDMYVKRRHAVYRGARHTNAKLTVEDVRRIRELAGSVTCASLAREYEVSESTIRNVVRGKTYVG